MVSEDNRGDKVAISTEARSLEGASPFLCVEGLWVLLVVFIDVAMSSCPG